MTIEQVLHSANIRSAYKQVVSNRGSAGVDGMTVSELLPHMQAHWDGLRKVVMDNDYVPDAILGVIIPKPNGSKRLLGIPTVTDRMLQQAVAQSPILRTTITLSRLEKRGYQSMAASP